MNHILFTHSSSISGPWGVLWVPCICSAHTQAAKHKIVLLFLSPSGKTTQHITKKKIIEIGTRPRKMNVAENQKVSSQCFNKNLNITDNYNFSHWLLWLLCMVLAYMLFIKFLSFYYFFVILYYHTKGQLLMVDMLFIVMSSCTLIFF